MAKQKSDSRVHIDPTAFKDSLRGRLAGSVGRDPVTLNLRVASSSPTLGMELI